MQSFKNRSIATVGAIVATLATVAAASPARAETREAHVRYADLNLNSASDAAMLDRRIIVAAKKVCGPDETVLRVEVRRCVRDSITRAKADLPASTRATMIAAR